MPWRSPEVSAQWKWAAREDLHSVALHISRDKIQWWWWGEGRGVQVSAGPRWWESLYVITHAQWKGATVTLWTVATATNRWSPPGSRWMSCCVGLLQRSVCFNRWTIQLWHRSLRVELCCVFTCSQFWNIVVWSLRFLPGPATTCFFFPNSGSTFYWQQFFVFVFSVRQRLTNTNEVIQPLGCVVWGSLFVFFHSIRI